jgi:hypothetical protein
MFLSLIVKELSCSSHRKSFCTRIVRLMNHLNELLAVANMNCQPMLRHLFAKLLTSLSFLELKQDCTYLMRQYSKQTSSVIEGDEELSRNRSLIYYFGCILMTFISVVLLPYNLWQVVKYTEIVLTSTSYWLLIHLYMSSLIRTRF